MARSLKAFGKKLRKLLNSKPVLELLAQGDWGAGGCWILAQTLADYLGPPATLLAVSERKYDDEILIPVSHVVVRYEDVYIDYNGAQSEEELLDNLTEDGYEYPELHEWSEEFIEIAMRKGIPCDPRARKELMKHLVRTFG